MTAPISKSLWDHEPMRVSVLLPEGDWLLKTLIAGGQQSRLRQLGVGRQSVDIDRTLGRQYGDPEHRRVIFGQRGDRRLELPVRDLSEQGIDECGNRRQQIVSIRNIIRDAESKLARRRNWRSSGVRCWVRRQALLAERYAAEARKMLLDPLRDG